jgi:hypothetical protein
LKITQINSINSRTIETFPLTLNLKILNNEIITMIYIKPDYKIILGMICRFFLIKLFL